MFLWLRYHYEEGAGEHSIVGRSLFFDHGYPADRGYGYVGASRFRSAGGLFHYGRLRRSDWRPVGGDPSIEISAREGDSANTDEAGLEAMDRDAEYEDSDCSGFGHSDCGSMDESCSDSEAEVDSSDYERCLALAGDCLDDFDGL